MVILRQACIGVEALYWRASITVGPRVRRLSVTVLEQSVPTIEADTTFLRAEDAWESAWISSTSIMGDRAGICRRFLERKNVRRINLRCNVDWLPDGGGRKCTREAHVRLLRGDRRLVRTRWRHRGSMSAWLTYGQGKPCLILLIDNSKFRGATCFNRSRQA